MTNKSQENALKNLATENMSLKSDILRLKTAFDELSTKHENAKAIIDKYVQKYGKLK